MLKKLDWNLHPHWQVGIGLASCSYLHIISVYDQQSKIFRMIYNGSVLPSNGELSWLMILIKIF